MADVHVLPGIERRDLAGEPVACETMFQAALEHGVHEGVVVGLDRAGELFVAASGADTDRAVGLLMRAVTYLTTHRVEQPDASAEPA